MLFWPNLKFPPINLWSAPRRAVEAAKDDPLDDFVWPSDASRANSEELDRVCDAMELAFDTISDLRQDNRELRREVAAWRGQ